MAFARQYLERGLAILGREHGIAVAAESAFGDGTRYFAEGATSSFFDTFFAMLNPGPTAATVLAELSLPPAS